jgi:hypothetical protein
MRVRPRAHRPVQCESVLPVECDSHLDAAVLRPGNAPATRGALGVLRRMLSLLRPAFPGTRFLVRLDGGFATPDVLDALDAEPGLDYVVAMGTNAVLARRAESAMAEARALSEASGQTAHVYLDTDYARRHVGARAPRGDQGGSRAPAGADAAR